MNGHTSSIIINIVIKSKEMTSISNNFFDVILESFDPSLLQNVVLAILAIFIPYGIVFLSASFQNRDTTNEFSRLLINDEVFALKRLFVVAVSSIIFLSFFSGTEIESWKKVIALLAALYVVYLLQGSFWKMVRYSEDSRSLDMDLLKRLTLKKKKALNNTKVIKVWKSFWIEITDNNEYEFNDIFIKKINDGIQKGLYTDSVAMMDTYIDDLDSKNMFPMEQTTLPKVLLWNEKLIAVEQSQLDAYKAGEKNNLYNGFWDWHYFQTTAFKKIVTTLTLRDHTFLLFDTFTKYIEEKCKLIEAEDDAELGKIELRHLDSLVTTFNGALFSAVLDNESRLRDWRNNFPAIWEIKGGNADHIISRIFAGNFIELLRSKYLFSETQAHNSGMSDIVKTIFPDADNTLFPAFLKLLDHDPISAITLSVNFHASSIFTYSGSGERPTSQEVMRMAQAQRDAEKESILNVIYTYFHGWRHLQIHKDDLSEQQYETWDTINKNEQRVIAREIRDIKLKRLLIELKSDKIIEKATESDTYEQNRKDMLELITSLISFNLKYTE